ncbi:MAG: sulfite exporter TauE/SafE family protein [Burkholderiaceae bacterium]
MAVSLLRTGFAVWSGELRPPPMPDVVFIPAVIAAGFFVLGVTGFGSALVIVPLLSWVWPLERVVPLVILLDFAGSLLLGGLNRRLVDAPLLRRLLPWIVAGCVLGALLLTLPGVNGSRWLVAALGAYVIWVGVRGLWAMRAAQGSASVPPARSGLFDSVPASGALAGVIEVLFGTSGPVVVSHLARRIADGQRLRATIVMCLVLLSGIGSLTLALSGRWSDPQIWAWMAPLLAVALAAMVLGHRLAHRLPAARIRQAILVLLVASGLSLWAQALRGL